MIIGYARTARGGTERQVEALKAAGCSEVFTDPGISGMRASRPGLDACLARLREGDTLVVPDIARLSRSVSDVMAVANDLRRRGVRLRSLADDLDV